MEGIQRLNAKTTKQKQAIEVARWLQALNLAQYTQEFLAKGYDSLRTLALLDFDDFQYVKVQPAHHQSELRRAASAAAVCCRLTQKETNKPHARTVLLYAARELQRKGAALPPTRDEVDVRARRSAIESELAPLRAFAAQHDVRRDAVSELSANMTKRAADIDKRAAAAAAQRDADAATRYNALAKVVRAGRFCFVFVLFLCACY